eukprot:SAG31_NODE_837_length_11633_cov_18.437663_2_plen_297_part_00
MVTADLGDRAAHIEWAGDAAASLLEAYERDGFVTLPGFLSPHKTAELRDATEKLFEREGTAGLGAYAAPSCRRLGNLFDKGSCFELLACDPTLVAFARRTIGSTGCRWQAFNAHDPLPGLADARQPIHADRSFFPGCTAYANVILALDDFTADNGAPRIVPGSNHNGAWPTDELSVLNAVPGEVRVPCSAGTAIVCHGDVWHGGMENFSDSPRRALHLGFACPATRPQYEITGECSTVMRRRVTARGLASLFPQSLSSFDGRPPDRPNKIGQQPANHLRQGPGRCGPTKCKNDAKL